MAAEAFIKPVETPEDESADDFELISDNSLVEATENISIISNEYESRDGGGDVEEEEEDEESVRNHHEAVTARAIDPLGAFEMIQSEHRLLKDELLSQNELLRQLEQRERVKCEEMTKLKEEVVDLTHKLNGAKEERAEMERQLEYFKKSSEKADSLMAELMESRESAAAEKKALLRQLQENEQAINKNVTAAAEVPPSVVRVSSSSLSSAAHQQVDTLTAELAKKEEHIKKMEGSLCSLEGSLSALHKERTKVQSEAERLKVMNVDLQELVTAQQHQAEMDKAEWAAIRFDMEQQIELLSDRVAAFEQQQQMSGGGGQNSPFAQQETLLQHRDAISPENQCPRCHLPRANAIPHPCPSIIDLLD